MRGKVCFVRGGSAFYTGVSDCMAGNVAERLHNLRGEKPEEVEELEETCHTGAFQGMEGSWPFII